MSNGPFRGIESACRDIEQICTPNMFAGAVIAQDVQTPVLQQEHMQQFLKVGASIRKDPTCARIMGEEDEAGDDIRGFVDQALKLMCYDMDADDEQQVVLMKHSLTTTLQIRHLLQVNPPQLERHAGISRHPFTPGWRERLLRTSVDILNLTDLDQFEAYVHSLATARTNRDVQRIVRKTRECGGMIDLLGLLFDTESVEMESRLFAPAHPDENLRVWKDYDLHFRQIADQYLLHLQPTECGLPHQEKLAPAVYAAAAGFRKNFYLALSANKNLRDDSMWNDVPTN